MNMNPTPDWSRPLRWHRARTDGNPLPMWARVLAVVLVFGGYGLLEAHDAATEPPSPPARPPTWPTPPPEHSRPRPAEGTYHRQVVTW